VLGLTGMNLAASGADQQDARADGRHHHKQAQPFCQRFFQAEQKR